MGSLLPPASEGWGKVLFSVCQSTPREGGSQVQVGGSQVQVQVGGVPGPGRGGGGVPSLRSREGGGGLYPVLVKGKIFDTRFGLIHVQTGKKIFCQGTPPSPPVKEKIFDTRFGLIHVQTGKKIFVKGPVPQ